MNKKRSSNAARKSFRLEVNQSHQLSRQVTHKATPTASILVLESGSKQISEPLRKEANGDEEQKRNFVEEVED
jgi:hypothetical protein